MDNKSSSLYNYGSFKYEQFLKPVWDKLKRIMILATIKKDSKKGLHHHFNMVKCRAIKRAGDGN